MRIHELRCLGCRVASLRGAELQMPVLVGYFKRLAFLAPTSAA